MADITKKSGASGSKGKKSYSGAGKQKSGVGTSSSTKKNTSRKNQTRPTQSKSTQSRGAPQNKSRTAASRPAKSKSTAKKVSNSKLRKFFLGNAKSTKDILVRIITILFIALLAAYIIYEIYFWFFAKIETVTAMSATVSETLETTGIAIRDENVITTTKSGVIVSTVENGAKVYKGETVANVFESEADAAAYHRLMEIDRSLAEFESMQTAAEDTGTDIKSMEKQLSERLVKFSVYTCSGELGAASDLSSDILYLLNKSQIATKKETDGFSKRIDELKKEKAELEQKYSKEPEKLTSPMSGYFISSIDGYESILNTSIMEGLTPEKLDSLLSGYHEPDSSMVIGKIADDYKWDIVCDVSQEDAQRLTEGGSYKIYLPYSDTECITAKLSTITPGEDGKRSLLSFRCTYMVSDLSVFRSQPITIELSSFTGLQVNESCIVYEARDVKKEREVERITSSGDIVKETEEYTENEPVPGVYILWGNEVKFRRVEIIYSSDGKAICSESHNEQGWLKRYDKIVTKTKGLHDGKIVLGAS